jgi:hypothetical protein
MGRSEDRCRYIFKAGENHYALNRLQDSAQAHEFEISK